MTGLRRIVATALASALVAFLLAGCGDDTSTQTTKTSTTKTSKASGSSTVRAEDMVGQIVTPGELTPQDFKDSLASRQPIVVTFYMNGPADDAQVRSSVQTLKSKYQGRVVFYDYLYSDGQKYGDLTQVLKVTTSPTVVVINCQSQVQRAWSGYVDSKSIEQGIDEALKNGCTGSSSGTTTGTSTTRGTTSTTRTSTGATSSNGATSGITSGVGVPAPPEEE